jgi:hypothetical protein
MRKLSQILALLVLAGCGAVVTPDGLRAPAGGTAVTIDGMLCGQQIKIQVADINDRGSFTGRCFDPATGNPVLEVSTSERNASTAIEAMAASMQQQASTIADVVGRIRP